MPKCTLWAQMIKTAMKTFKFDFCSIFQRSKTFFEVEDASDANRFKIPTQITFELDASQKYQ